MAGSDDSFQAKQQELNVFINELDKMQERSRMRQRLSSEKEAMSREALDELVWEDDDVESIDLAWEEEEKNDDVPVGVRMYEEWMRKKEFKEQEAQSRKAEQEAMELVGTRPKPKITSNASKLPARDVQYYADMAEKQKEKKEFSAHKILSEREDVDGIEIQKKFKLSPASEELIQDLVKEEKYIGPISGWSTRFAQFSAAKNAVPEPCSFHPNINPSSRKMFKGEGPTHERLFNEAKAREEKLVLLKESYEKESSMDKRTGQPLYKPSTHCHKAWGPWTSGDQDASSGSSTKRTVNELVSDLCQRGEMRQQFRQQLGEAVNEECTFRPCISQYSEYITSRKERKPLYQTPQAASPNSTLQGRSQSTPQSTARELKWNPNRSVGSSPSTSSKSKSKARSGEFETRTDKYLADKEANREKLRQELEDRDMAECTFTPQICKHSATIFNNTAGQEDLDVANAKSPKAGSLLSGRNYGGVAREASEITSPQAKSNVASRPQPRTAKPHQEPPAMAATKAKTPNPTQQKRSSTKATAPGGVPDNKSILDISFSGTSITSSMNMNNDQDFAQKMEDLDSYIANFEQEMSEVLEEWRHVDARKYSATSQPVTEPLLNSNASDLSDIMSF